MEIVLEQPPEGQRHHTAEYQLLIVAECAPHPLLYAIRAIRCGSRGSRISSDAFPVLSRVEGGSQWYVDEDMWLSPAEAVQLLDEFTRLRGVCREEESIPGLDGRLVATRSARWGSARRI